MFRKWCQKSGMIFTLVMGTSIEKIITVGLRIFQQSFPNVRVSSKRWQDKPWVTKSLKISIKLKDKFNKACLVHPSEQKHERYKNYKIILRTCLGAENRNYEELLDYR